MTDDLWPTDLADIEPISVPSAILMEQADVLRRKTYSVLEGSIHNSRESDMDDDDLIWHFLIYCPILKYSFELFHIYHSVELYPLRLWCEDPEISHGATTINIDSEEEFKNILRRIFSSKRTKRILVSLISQAKSKKSKAQEEDESEF